MGLRLSSCKSIAKPLRLPEVQSPYLLENGSYPRGWCERTLCVSNPAPRLQPESAHSGFSTSLRRSDSGKGDKKDRRMKGRRELGLWRAVRPFVERDRNRTHSKIVTALADCLIHRHPARNASGLGVASHHQTCTRRFPSIPGLSCEQVAVDSLARRWNYNVLLRSGRLRSPPGWLSP